MHCFFFVIFIVTNYIKTKTQIFQNCLCNFPNTHLIQKGNRNCWFENEIFCVETQYIKITVTVITPRIIIPMSTDLTYFHLKLHLQRYLLVAAKTFGIKQTWQTQPISIFFKMPFFVLDIHFLMGTMLVQISAKCNT